MIALKNQQRQNSKHTLSPQQLKQTNQQLSSKTINKAKDDHTSIIMHNIQYKTDSKSKADQQIPTQIKTNKNIRTFRQEITILNDTNHPKQFIAYCIINKQSQTGIFSHQRLLVLNSLKKQIAYYSNIPQLPLQKTQVLSDTEKEVIKISEVQRFAYLQQKNGIGEATIRWNEGGETHEWRITFGSRRIAREFGVLVEEVRSGKYLNRQKTVSVSTVALQNKIHKTETIFIEELKKLQENEQKKSSLSKISKAISSDIELKTMKVIQKNKYQNNQPKVILQKSQADKQFITESTEKQQQQTDKTARIRNQNQKNKNIIKPQQLNFQKIIDSAEQQHNQKIQTKSPLLQIKNVQPQISEIQISSIKSNISLNKRKINTNNGLSQSKVMVHPIQKQITLSQQLNDKKYRLSLDNKQQPTQPQQTENRHRLSLLQERRQTYTQGINKKTNVHNHPRKENSQPKHNLASKQTKQKRWMQQWLMARSESQMSNIYSQFVQHCAQRVKKLSNRFADWHLLHKKQQQYTFQQQQVFYSYVMLTNPAECGRDKQQQYLTLFQNYNMVLLALRQYIQHKNEVKFAVPLICIVRYKTLQVLCQTYIKPNNDIEINQTDSSKYQQELKILQNYVKVSLHNKQLLQIKINQKTIVFFSYLQTLINIRIQNHHMQIDEHYIQKYINNGVIKTTYDIAAIAQHVKSLFPKIMKQINSFYPTSTIELLQYLHDLGINHSFIPYLYQQTAEKQYHHAAALLLSELFANAITEHIRHSIHHFLIGKHSINRDNIICKVHSIISHWLRKQPNLIILLAQFLPKQIKNKIHLINLNKHIYNQYVLSSIFSNLGLRCDIKCGVQLSQLQNLQFDFWEWIKFQGNNINLFFTHQTVLYHYSYFAEHYQSINKMLADHSMIPDQQQIIDIMCQPGELPMSSSLAKLLPTIYKIKLSYYLVHFQIPHKNKLQPNYDSQNTYLYFNLQYHPTDTIPTFYSYAQDLIGIKWLIKKKHYAQAQTKLQQQLYRAYIWGKRNPKILMDVLDLQSMFFTIIGKSAESLQSSLQSMQISIEYYRQDLDNYSDVILEKTFTAANIHFGIHKMEKALELFETCQKLMEKVREQEIEHHQINLLFLEIYSNKIAVLMSLGQINQAVALGNKSLLYLAQWKLNLDKQSQQMSQKLQNQLLKINLLIYRAYQIQNRKKQLLQLSSEFTKILTNNNPSSQQTLPSSHQHKLIQITKCAWNAIVVNSNKQSLTYNHYLHRNFPHLHNIHLAAIKTLLIQIYKANHYKCQYSIQEVQGYLLNRVSLFNNKNNEFNYSCSRLMLLMLQTLNQLSKQATITKRCTLYQANCEQNQLLFLECLATLISFQFIIGCINAQIGQFCSELFTQL